MAQKKKLQVFVSSTYIDLHEERQAAVQAILTAGHIPAGMELFAAGDETQMNVIKRWIDESDVYMLILGGRYGSIEPKSQKSYIHLEYEYALEKNKALFAVVIDEKYLEKKIKKHGSSVIEKDQPDKLKGFREFVCSKMVRFWSDPKDIKLAILETIADFSRRDELIGWIPGNESVNTGEVAEEIARLAKENTNLREKIESLKSYSGIYNGLTFQEMYKLLLNTHYAYMGDNSKFHQDLSINLKELSTIFGDESPGFIHAVWLLRNYLRNPSPPSKIKNDITSWLDGAITTLDSFGFVENKGAGWYLNESGKQFLIRLRLNLSAAGNKIHGYYFEWNPETNIYKIVH